MFGSGGSVERVIPATPRREAREQGAGGSDTRERILAAAHDCLARVGYERITTRRIAEEAGVNIATLHYYFGTKEALLTEATRYAYRQSEQALRGAINAAPNAPAALEAALTETWRLVSDRPGILRYDLAVRAFRDEDARREVSTIYAVYRRLTEEILEKHVASGGALAPGMAVGTLAHYIVAAVDGVVLQYAITGDEDAARFSLALILDHALLLMGEKRATQTA
jgi:AcrR family transcriptional regulator